MRVGSESREASELQFKELIAQRHSKAREILKWKGKTVTLHLMGDRGSKGMHTPVVEDCNQFYLTYRQGDRRLSVPLRKVDITFDHEKDRLQLEVESP